MTRPVVGIDPANSGALALLSIAGELLEIEDMPCIADGVKGRWTVIRRWPRRAELFGRVKDDGRAEAALIAIAGMKRDGSNV
jgi:hypothetical protein